MAETPTARVRPTAVPADLAALSGPGARGPVQLPRHVRWSGPPTIHNLDERSHRISVYEQVLCEGTPVDVADFIGLDDLIDLWDDLYLPDHVRRAWSEAARDQLGIELPI